MSSIEVPLDDMGWSPPLSRFRYCMIDVRCSLCRFRYDENDLITTLCPAGKLAPPFRFRGLQRTKLYQEVDIHMCGRRFCIEIGKFIYTFHPSCFSMAPEYFYSVYAPVAGNVCKKAVWPDREYMQLIAYDYRPSFEDEKLRARRIRDMAAAKLQKSIVQDLPPEIVNLCAENLVMEVAALYSREIFATIVPPASPTITFTRLTQIRLDLTKDIHVAYREIEGVSYIQWITNTDLFGKGHLVYKAQEGKKLDCIHIALDVLGVRRVFFEQPPDDVDSGPGSSPYWMTIEPDEEMVLRCTHDGLKIRRIADSRESSYADLNENAWPMLNPAYKRLSLDGLELGATNLPKRMKLLECQGFHIEGYYIYVCSHAALINFVIAETKANQQDIRRTFNTLSYGDWMYMPLDPGEHVEDTWLVKFGNGEANSLMFLTNFGRASMLGTMGRPGGAHKPSFLRVFSRSCGPQSQLYLSDNDYRVPSSMVEVIGVDKKIQNLATDDVQAFVQNIKPEWDPYPPSLTSTASPWPPSFSEQIFTKCHLENVTHITCCVNQQQAHKPIVGMMLHYQGGGRACLGHYRHDWVQPSLRVIDPESMPLIIRMYRDCEADEADTTSKGRYILGVSVGDAHVKSSEAGDLHGDNVWKTLIIPWFGSLEWWFGNVVDYWNFSGYSFFHVTHVP